MSLSNPHLDAGRMLIAEDERKRETKKVNERKRQTDRQGKRDTRMETKTKCERGRQSLRQTGGIIDNKAK